MDGRDKPDHDKKLLSDQNSKLRALRRSSAT
jgi:hypothetical protein